MKENLTHWSFLIVLPIILLSFFLNFLSSSYSEIDLFKLDLVQKNKPKTSQRLVFILKNNHLFFTIICFFQVILNMLISTILIEEIPTKAVWEKTGISKRTILFGIAFFTALFTELLARFLAVRKNNKKVVNHPFFINLTYLILRPFSFLQIVIKPKKKLFSDSEKDIIRFFNNLLAEKVLEEKEVRLVQSALRFDELTVESLVVPYHKVVFLEETMSLAEVKKVYLQNSFTRYPVRDRKKKIIGILSIKRVFFLTERKEDHWQNQIDKKLPYLLSSTKLNKAFEKTQTWNRRMLIIKNQKKNSPEIIEGIITLHDILNALVGKMNHTPEKTFPLLPP
ncbi:MAG: CBS domain-containing protein [Candidatus Moeniiplasma glomeromycotorum]|nr:CBS domain-containing protein [Candidatus Moeniiplasma glomeromycotorum]MCE8168305.1 CBS domain-containing protein [Candidatus Moeniiplasma glomeromycotorum]MCE8169484.1 CBS domain-containing protein [Candidatus Moeniiplasma glomeromycotorum]